MWRLGLSGNITAVTLQGVNEGNHRCPARAHSVHLNPEKLK
ncbi:MAG: hypothetical protein QOK23_2673 [Gammaproteobacteria bacterium]|jgi:hypothetical protein|nr:hypothetical protein [Gammaproteobacteria bacterium]